MSTFKHINYQTYLFLLAFILLCEVILVHAQDPRMKVFNQDSQKMASLKNNRLVDQEGEVLYTIKGNIVFRGASTSKNQIELLSKTNDLLNAREARVYPRHMKKVKFTIRKGRIFYKKGLQIQDAGLIAQFETKSQNAYSLQNYKNEPLATIRGKNLSSAHLLAAFYHIYMKKHLDRNVKRRITNVEKVKKKESQQKGIIKPYWAREGQEWVWDGEVLKPRWETHQRDHWKFDGRIMEPVYFSDPHEVWVWDGKKLEPRWNDSDVNTYIWEGDKLKPYWVSDTEREYKYTGEIVKPLWGSKPEDEWIVKGDIPKPIIAIVVLGIANR